MVGAADAACHVICQNIQILGQNIWFWKSKKNDGLYLFTHHLDTRPIQITARDGPFEFPTSPVFGWSLLINFKFSNDL